MRNDRDPQYRARIGWPGLKRIFHDGVLVLGEPLRPAFVFAGVLVGCGIVLVNRTPQKPRQ